MECITLKIVDDRELMKEKQVKMFKIKHICKSRWIPDTLKGLFDNMITF